MQQPRKEVAHIIRCFGKDFILAHHPNAYQVRVLDALSKCRTSALGGHKQRCDCCARERISYNSCRNRHCPKCQTSQQAFWVEECMERVLPVKHFHMVFTLPQELNVICLLDSPWFYNLLFACVWDTLRSFGYTHYGVESGAVCVLHTWGQNLSLHPHLHCIVPAAGQSLAGHFKHIAKEGKYLYPVHALSAAFRSYFMLQVKKWLLKQNLLDQYQSSLDQAWAKSWVVFCEPSFSKPEHVIGYLGQYIHRVAISNHRILDVQDDGVTFLHKDYRDQAKEKMLTLSPVEFLRRFCLHILPLRFVKVRYFGIYSSRFRAISRNQNKKMVIKVNETSVERLLRLSGFDFFQCPFCKKGRMVTIEIIPRVRSPSSFLYCSFSSYTL